MILANNSRTETVAATVNLPTAYVTASYMELTAPSIDAMKNTDITLGGSRVGEDGSWSPRAQGLTLTNNGKTINILVKTGSALWVKMEAHKRVVDSITTSQKAD